MKRSIRKSIGKPALVLALAAAMTLGIASPALAAGASGSGSVSRADMAQALYELEGSPAVSGSPFTDVADSQIYADAVAWAAQAGVVEGVGSGHFAPDASITRQEATVMLYRYAEYKDLNVGERRSLDKFTDGTSVSDWAKVPMRWAVAEGIVDSSDGRLNPAITVRQSDLEQMLANFEKSDIDRKTDVITVPGGQIVGTVNDHGVRIYKGIPYAASTAGENRWKAPQPVESWEGVRNCTQYGDIAMQNEATTYGGEAAWTDEYLDLGMTVQTGEMSEECLNLNVWTAADPGDKLPVIVYIHGGGNNSGSGSNEVYTGENIAEKDVVWVSINYRVGIFGFLAYKDSTGEEVRGNFATMDQIAALKWVQENIAKFGGDPENVTIAGQSAGAGNVQTLVTSPAAAGLFHKAVVMSGNSYSNRPLQTVEQAQEAASQRLGDYTLADLRAMSGEEVQALSMTYNPSSTVLDGQIVTQSLKEAYDSGSYNQVDMLWGCVTEDASMFSALQLPDDDGNPFSPVVSVTPENLVQAIRDSFGEDADTILELYPVDMSAKDQIGVAKQINFDSMITGYYQAASAKQAGDPSHDTFIYNFSRVVPDTPERMAKNGAFHTGDVGYWTNHFTTTSYPRDWSQVDYDLGDTMSDYLVSFAYTGDPNHEGAPTWSTVSDTAPITYMDLGDTVQMTSMSAERAEFWLDRQG